MHDIQGKVLSVSSAAVGQHGNLLYSVAFSDGQTYKTFKNDVATQAQQLVGQDVVANVNVGPNPKKPEYINYDLIAIKPSDVGAIVQLGTTQTQPIFAPIPQAAPRQDFQRRMFPDVEERVTKLSALNTAFAFVSRYAGELSLEDAEAKSVELAKRIFAHAFGNPVVPTTAPEVAAQVNEVLGTAAVATGAVEATKDW